MKERREASGTVNSVVSYQYNPLGQLSGITYPSGKTVAYHYADGRIDQISSNGATLLSQISYNAANQVTSWRWANGAMTQRSYDQDGRLIQQSLADSERSLAYDLVGNILNINDGLNQHGYGYDPMNRLLSASDYNLSYTYDRNGNRLTANSATELNNYSYDPSSSKLAAIQGPAVKNYQYDETGNTLSDGLHAYLYDAKNQLTDITGVASYFYNGLGQRTAKNSNYTLTHYVYDENARLIGEYNAAGQAIQETVYLFGQPIAILKGTEIYNVHTDHLGTPRKITSQAGNTVWQWLDKPFGDASINQDPDGNGVAFEYNLRFPGQYFDVETGLHYNLNRYYDPQTGRYITSDPIGLRGGLNTYGYVGGNPVNWIDPLGLYPGEETVNYVGGAMGGTGDFMQSYMAQQKATHFDDRSAPYHGWANQDKYFHCRANCEAAQRGNGGSDVAKCLSDIHEWGDQTWDGDSLADSAADQEANLYGREQGVADQGGNCQALCNKYRPSTLPGDY